MPAADPYAKFLLQCLREEARSVPAQADWNWGKFIEVASAEMLSPALHGLLAQQELVHHLPVEVADFFFAARELNRKRNCEIVARIEIIASALNGIGIQPLLLKGAAYLLSAVYADPSDRFLVDIDFLVAKEDLPATLDVLRQHGYSFDRVDPIDHATNHTFAVFSRADSMTVDLHQTVGLGASSDVLPAAEILDRSEVRTLGSARVRIPCPTDLVTHHILHSQVHELYRDRIWTPLRSLYDLALLERRFATEVDWHSIVLKFKRRRLYGALVLYLMLARKMTGFTPPVALRPGLLVRMRWQHRQLLRSMPRLRFIDPFWFYSAGVEPRIRRLRSILQEPGGIRYLLRKLFSVDFFLRLKTDLS